MKTTHPLRQLLHIASVSKSKTVFATVCSIANKICDIVPEILIGLSIDVVVNQERSLVSALGISNPYNQLLFIGGITALFWILESIFEYLYSIAWHDIALSVQETLRIKTYAHVQTLDLSYFENKTAGSLLSVLHQDINELEQFLAKCPNEIIQLAVNIVVMGAIFFYLSPTLALLTLIPIPFVIAIAYYFQHKLASLYAQVRETSATLAAHIGYRLHGIATIICYNTGAYEVARLQKRSDEYTQVLKKTARINAQYIPIVRMAVMFGFIVSLVIGGFYCVQGIIPINWYAALVFLTQRFLWPFTSISSITDTYEQAMASAKRILEVIQTQPSIVSKQSPDTQLPTFDVSFENVSFEYGPGKPLFTDFNFKIDAGKTVAFVGSTGSGKSTLVKLLLRLYQIGAGKIAIGGKDVSGMSLAQLRDTIALVSQDVYLVEGTIAENIAYGSFDATQDQIVAAARMAHAHEFIESLPQGYNTMVAEHGKNLSGGQRQRLAIARAIIKKAPIIIFDEATSAIDNETEALIAQSIATLSKNHTIIIIAHKLNTVRNADTIVVLSKGSIVESGKHQELLNAGGAYAQLWNAA